MEHVLALAQTATSLDEHGKEEEAAACYRDVIGSLQRLRASLPGSLHGALDARVESYRSRTAVLDRCVKSSPRRASLADSNQETAHRGFTPSEARSTWRPPPPLELLRPFWALDLLRATCTTGGHISKRFYCPADVWRQDGIPLAGLSVKESFLRSTAALLGGLPRHDLPGADTTRSFVAAVLSTLPQLQALQDELHGQVPEVPSAKHGRRLVQDILAGAAPTSELCRPRAPGPAAGGGLRAMGAVGRRLRTLRDAIPGSRAGTDAVCAYGDAVVAVARAVSGVAAFIETHNADIRGIAGHDGGAGDGGGENHREEGDVNEVISPLARAAGVARGGGHGRPGLSHAAMRAGVCGLALFLHEAVAAPVLSDLAIMLRKFMRRGYKALRDELA